MRIQENNNGQVYQKDFDLIEGIRKENFDWTSLSDFPGQLFHEDNLVPNTIFSNYKILMYTWLLINENNRLRYFPGKGNAVEK